MENGFFFYPSPGNSEQSRCFSCGFTIFNFDSADKLIEEHYKKNSCNQFLKIETPEIKDSKENEKEEERYQISNEYYLKMLTFI